MDDWKIVKQNANREQKAKTIFHSFVQQRQYQINKVLDDRILVDRLSGGETAGFKKHEVANAIEILKKEKRVRKSSLLRSVVREVMLVKLHPYVEWDENSHELFWKPDLNKVAVNKVEDIIPNVPDDQLEKIQALILRRRHQNAFRIALLKLYQNKCAISQCEVDEVLQAAHVTKYSVAGNNSNNNGIILRNDLHILFDSNLLAIHPKNLTVRLHSKLKKSSYWKYKGIKIANRIDNSSIERKYLEERWIVADWLNK